MRRWLTCSSSDALLVLMVLIWGGNYAVVKSALAELPPQAFNAVRMVVASVVFAAAFVVKGGAGVARADWARLAVLGTVGHFVYQLLFMSGIARTTASNSALLIGCSPVAVSIASALAGHERVPRTQWAGVLLSVLGVYLVVGAEAEFGGASLAGDAFTLGAVCCWAIYTVGSRSMLARYSPLTVTGLTMIVGTALFVPAAIPQLVQVEWASVPAWAWSSALLSALLALNVAYLIWYTSVQRIGNVRTSAYSNFIPLIALSIAAATLGEPVGTAKLAGAGAILAGVVTTRLAARTRAKADPPAEE